MSLSDHGQECFGLTVAEMKKKIKDKKQKSHHWTGVVSTAHFTIAGCHDILLTEDIADAWAHIEATHKEGVLPWDFVFNADDYKLPESETDLEQFRLPIDNLEELGKKVTRLRAQASERSVAIESIGDAADTARLPPELNQLQLEEHAKLQTSKQLAKEMMAYEAHEMAQSGKLR